VGAHFDEKGADLASDGAEWLEHETAFDRGDVVIHLLRVPLDHPDKGLELGYSVKR
jgi:hypothetical protein